MLAPKARSGSAVRPNEIAKTTPANRIGADTSRLEPSRLLPARHAEKRVERDHYVQQQGNPEPEIIGPEPLRAELQDKEVGGQDHHQHREENEGIHHPGAAEHQGHAHHGLGLDQHEARAEKEHARVERPAIRFTRRRGMKSSSRATASPPMISPPTRIWVGIMGLRR